MVTADTVKYSIHTLTDEAMDFLDKVSIAVVDGGSAKLLYNPCRLRRARSVHFQACELPQLQECGADAAGSPVNQYALAWLYLCRTMQHLVCGDVVQDERDRFGRVQTSRNGNELSVWQAQVLCVTAADRHGCNRLAWFQTRNTFPDLIHNADQIPSGR